MIKVIDLKLGNIGSVVKSLKHVHGDVQVIEDIRDMEGARGIILPGVGSFKVASERLHKTGFFTSINNHVLMQQTPILGICLGMQLLAHSGEEGGKSNGLGLIDSKVKKINTLNSQVKIPHMGWNDVSTTASPIFKGIEISSCFYFVHSYAMDIKSTHADSIATTHHGTNIVAAVSKGHIHGVQFHPEKSQSPGLNLLRNFIDLC